MNRESSPLPNDATIDASRLTATLPPSPSRLPAPIQRRRRSAGGPENFRRARRFRGHRGDLRGRGSAGKGVADRCSGCAECARADRTLLAQFSGRSDQDRAASFGGDGRNCRERSREQNAKGIPLVVDPVMVATSGDACFNPKRSRSYRTRLFPRATLVTPNMAEAAALSGRPVRDLEEMRLAGKRVGAKIWDPRFCSRAVIWRGNARLICSSMDCGGGIFGAVCRRAFRLTAPVAPTRPRSLPRLALGDVLEEAIAWARISSAARSATFCLGESLGEIHALNHLLTRRSCIPAVNR